MKRNYTFSIKSFVNLSLFSFLIIFSGCDKKGSEPVEIKNIKKGTILEFIDHPILSDCPDPDKKMVTFLEGNKPKVYYWHKGCPNNVVTEEELIYSYRIDRSYNWRQEYSCVITL